MKITKMYVVIYLVGSCLFHQLLIIMICICLTINYEVISLIIFNLCASLFVNKEIS